MGLRPRLRRSQLLVLIVSISLTAGRPPEGVSVRTSPVLPGFLIPGNKEGLSRPQFVPGVSLPGQDKTFPNQIPFSPFSQVFGLSSLTDFGDSWSYGHVLHGVNPLNFPVKENFPFYASTQPLRTDGTFLPFDHIFESGLEYDLQKWHWVDGYMNIPDVRNGKVWDMVGNLNMKDYPTFPFACCGYVKGDLNFPMNPRQRFPLSGLISRQPPHDPYIEYGQALPNVNPHGIPGEEVLQNAFGSNPNPQYLGGMGALGQPVPAGRRRRRWVLADVLGRRL